MDEKEDVIDADEHYGEVRLRRRGEPGYASVWSPRISEQERAEREQQIADGIIPF